MRKVGSECAIVEAPALPPVPAQVVWAGEAKTETVDLRVEEDLSRREFSDGCHLLTRISARTCQTRSV